MDAKDYQMLVSQSSSLKPNSFKAIKVLIFVILVTTLGLVLSFSGNVWLWGLGQIVYALSVLQWFVLLHDFGHNYFFKSSRMNWFFGYLASALCLVPFAPWKWIHSQHHTWTGWHDLDPTQESTMPDRITPLKKKLANWSWRLYLPSLTLAFSLKNFWNLPRLFKIFKETSKRAQFVFSVMFLIISFSLQVYFIPDFLQAWAGGYLLFLVISDPLLISQHVHIPQKLSNGQVVSPITVKEQDIYTRSLVFPKWVSRYILLSFDKHTLHHVLPRLACYHLITINYQFTQSIPWLNWLKKAKRTPAETLLFSDNSKTGLNI